MSYRPLGEKEAEPRRERRLAGQDACGPTDTPAKNQYFVDSNAKQSKEHLPACATPLDRQRSIVVAAQPV